eukprot:GHVU01046683.1.p1 GENE.GHVU01046683.1~~GHVU01046683.1.p1  ORF type:complete len:347 (-),score=25.34 GHVU01046683.1:3-899(-)
MAHAYKVQFVKAPKDFLMHASEQMREDLLLSFIRAFAHFGASLNALEDLILDASRMFDIKVTVVRRNDAITCLIGERTGKRRYLRIVSPVACRSYFLGLLEVRRIYTAVIEHRMRVGEGRAQLANLCAKVAVRYPLAHLLVAGVLSGLICMAVLGGSSYKALVTVIGTIALGAVYYFLRKVTLVGAELLELSITITISLLAHDSHTSPILVGVLPGYLYLCSALKRVNKYAMTEFIVALFAATYTIVLVFGLPIILDLFLMTKLLALVVLVKKMWSATPTPSRPSLLMRDTTFSKSLV